ncbi:MAG: hypothetical protein CMI54_07330 [Parcubacteria group bacterium]|nr:hypothetical protein [Parcubacteria group bacterium]|tara:strand:- start:2398 stop:2727 length:330 start_codon:yes stop_codon:yes gene_type:complete
MKIIKQDKKGTKILLDNNEAMIAFTPQGIQTSMPHKLGVRPASMPQADAVGNYQDEDWEPTYEEVERLQRWIEENNPYLTVFMDVMTDLQQSDKFDQKWSTRQDDLGLN